MELTQKRAKENLSKLIERFERELNAGRIRDYNEEATKISFIQPLLGDVFGWNVKNHDEVSAEEKTSRGRVDYGLKLEGKIKLFIEAKPPRADLNKYIEQAVGYGYNRMSVPFVLLTDFEELKLFDVTVEPDTRDPLKGLKIDLKWDAYLQSFEKLWLLSKESVIRGELDKLLLEKPKKGRPVDKRILDDLRQWREILAKDIFKNNPHLFHSEDREKDANYLKEINQRILDRLIFMRCCEDRGLTHRGFLKEVFEERTETVGLNTMIFLKEEFKHYNMIFDSDLFRPQEWEDNLAIDFKVMRNIVLETYNPYQFDAIPLEVLGNIYEQYLGYTIRLTDHRVKYELKPAVRKAGGVYYTPEYIVDYIVKNTVGKLLEELPGRKIKKLRILDPACGSGSFLIRAYEEMLSYYRDRKKVQPKIKRAQREFALKHEQEEEPRLSIEEKSRILRDHIFGVDIDEQAVEVTKLSLMLKMLEGEYWFVPGRAILPMLDKNIKCGNSLISGSTLELKKYFGDDWYKVKPFNWEKEFRKIIVEESGFDAVIGNPPWVDIKGLDPDLVDYCFSHYSTTSNRMNVFAIFVERSLQLLRQSGYFGYIVPNSILLQSSYEKLRQKILKGFTVRNIARMPDSIFANVKAETVILVLQKTTKPRQVKNKIVIFERDADLKSFDYAKALEVKFIDQGTWNNQKYYAFNIFTSSDEIRIIKKIERAGIALYNLSNFSLGITPYDKYKGHTQKQIAERVFHTDRKQDSSCRPLLAGGDVSRYWLKWNGRQWLRYGSWLGAAREARFFTAKRILVRQIVSGKAARIFATMTSEEYCNTQTIFNVIPKNTMKESLQYLLGILNSKMMNFYHSTCYLDKSKILFQKILIQNAKQFPIRIIDFSKTREKKLHDDLVALVDEALDLNKKIRSAKGSEKQQIQRQIDKTDREIDELVYRLYGITEEERKIIEGEQ